MVASISDSALRTWAQVLSARHAISKMDPKSLAPQKEVLCRQTEKVLVAAERALTDLSAREAAKIAPDFQSLKTSIDILRTDLNTHPEVLSEERNWAEKWKAWGLPESVLTRYPDCVRFLMESEVGAAIVGYRDLAQHNVQLAADGHPMIKMEGQWTRWQEVQNRVEYDKNTYQVKSKEYPGAVAEIWTYLQQGLTRVDRLHAERLHPIHQLNPQDLNTLKAHARRFYENHEEVDIGTEKNCVLQFMTTPRRHSSLGIPHLPDNPLLDNFVDNINAHIVVRVVDQNGDVYSMGVEMPASSQQFLSSGKGMGTTTAVINKAGDYEEFRSFGRGGKGEEGRIVTSIPLTQDRAQDILRALGGLGPLRFHFMHQNCSSLQRLVMEKAGYAPINTKMTVAEFLYTSLPDAKALPYVGGLIGKIQEFVGPIFSAMANAVPECIQNGLSSLKAVVLYFPGKIGNFVLNLLLLQLGAGEMQTALPNGVEEEELEGHLKPFLNFSRVIRSWKDLFSDTTSELFHSKQFIKWQKEQPSTFIKRYEGKPELVLLPPRP